MAGEIRLQALSGVANVKVRITDQFGFMWDGSNLVDIDTLTDVNWTAALIACVEKLTNDGTGTGLYLADKPGGLPDGNYDLRFYSGASPVPDDPYIGIQEDFLLADVTTDTASRTASKADVSALALEATLATVSGYVDALDLYHADIDVSIDEANTQDEYTITWFKNGVRVTSGITVPTIQVIKRVDGTDLIASTTPTQIGTTGSYKKDEASNRITAGEAVVVVGATIDGAPRTFARVVSRDSIA